MEKKVERLFSSSLKSKFFIYLFIYLESFNLWRPFLMIVLYYLIKILISFWCRRRLNPKSLIQLLDILPVELTRTRKKSKFIYITFSKKVLVSIKISQSQIDLNSLIRLINNSKNKLKLQVNRNPNKMLKNKREMLGPYYFT